MANPKITLYNKPLFEKKIIEIYDPIHNQRYWFVRCKNGQEFNEILLQIIPGYEEKVEMGDEEERVDGECVDLVLDGKLVVILWCNLLDIDALVHECLHAVLFSAKSRGISLTDDESLCYMLGHLTTELLKKANVSLHKGRKPRETKLSLDFPEDKLNGIQTQQSSPPIPID